MSSTLDFILKLTDMLTPAMRSAAGVSDSAAARIQGNMDRITGRSRTMNASLNEMRQRLEAVNNVRFGTRLVSEFNAATREAQRLERQIASLENKGKGGGGNGGVFGGMLKANLVTGMIGKGMGMVANFAGDVASTTMESLGTKSALNATTKGQGAQAFGMTSAISNKYGLNLEANLEGVKTLTGGLMSLNMPLEKQMKIFEGVASGAAALKLSSEQTKGAMLALGQMASKGTVSAEELRGQLGERIPGAFGIAAQAMGVTEAKLNSMLQKGEIAASDFLPKFAAQMEKSFGAQALANANGPHAIVERFNNAMFSVKTTIGEGLMPIVTPLIEKFTVLANMVIPYISAGIQQIVNWVSGINTGSETWTTWMTLIGNHAMNIWNLVRSVFMNVWNIVSGVVQWLAKSELIQDIAWLIGKAFEGISWVVMKIGDGLEWIWENVLKPILDGIEWVYKSVKNSLGFGGKATVEQKVTVGGKVTTAAPTVPGGVTPNTFAATGATVSGGLDAGKTKSESINNGGQRSIVINIGKQIEKMEISVLDAKQGANEIEQMVREAMRRVLYNLNGVATS